MTIALLAALAAATIFLDFQIAAADRRRLRDHDQLSQALRADHDAIQRIDVAMDGAARRADLDGVNEKVAAAAAAVQKDGSQVREQIESVQKEVGALQRDLRGAAGAVVDYRPLFEDLRQQLQRHGAAIAELRTAGPAAPAAPVEAAAPPPSSPGPGSGAEALPAPLAEQVRKLQSNDPAVRFEAVDELLRSKNAAVLPHLLPLARDPDSFVRRLTVEGLKDHKRPEVVEVLLAALGDADDLVRDQAWRSLREVSGQRLPFDANGTKDARARAQQRWQEWWDKSKATFGT